MDWFASQDSTGPGFNMTHCLHQDALFTSDEFDSLTFVNRYVEAAILKCNRFLNKS